MIKRGRRKVAKICLFTSLAFMLSCFYSMTKGRQFDRMIDALGVTPSAFLASLGFSLVTFLVSGFYLLLTKPAAEDLSWKDKEWAEIFERFPLHQFPRMTPKFYRYIFKEKDIDLNFRDEDKSLWKNIITRWPKAPQTDNESQANEQAFWAEETALHTVTTEDAPQLAARQQIKDYYGSNERWIFRKFFAATGTFHESVYNDSFFWLFKNKARMPTEQYNAKIDRWRQHKDQHIKEWSSWYIGNVQKTFADANAETKQVEQPLAPARDLAKETGRMR